MRLIEMNNLQVITSVKFG